MQERIDADFCAESISRVAVSSNRGQGRRAGEEEDNGKDTAKKAKVEQGMSDWRQQR